MMSEAENCNQQCGSCSSDCASRQEKPASLLESLHPMSQVKKVIGVVSGKGGVGKSLVTSSLAVLLNRQGLNTAILDADITGPSIPKIFGLQEKAKGNESGLLPVKTKTGIQIMSINLLLEDEDVPVVWRGPLIAGTVKQFWTDVIWEDVDCMFVDMPPGTGDVPLSVFQSIPLDGIIVVTSPQELVSMIVAKAVNMAKMMHIPILGIVENMSYVQCPDCQKKIYAFGESHLEETAEKYGLTVLAQLPIDPNLSAACDSGNIEEFTGDWLNEAASKVMGLAGNTLRIAIPTDLTEVFQHFGQSTLFTVYDITNGKIAGKSVLDTSESGHAALADLLQQNNVDLVICGGIGSSAKTMLQDAGIRLISGVSGNIDEVTASYLAGNLQNNPELVCNHHESENHPESGACQGGCGGHCH